MEGTYPASLFDALRSADAEVRRSAIERLVVPGAEPAVFDRLAEIAVADPSDEVRLLAGMAAAVADVERAPRLYLQMLDDPAGRVRASAASNLGRDWLGALVDRLAIPPGTLDRLQRVAREDADRIVRRRAAESARQIEFAFRQGGHRVN